MIKDTLNTLPKLQIALKVAEAYVSALHKDTPYQSFEDRSTPNSFTLCTHFGNNEEWSELKM